MKVSQDDVQWTLFNIRNSCCRPYSVDEVLKVLWSACSMIFGPNDSPLAGREGSHLTGSKIGERLHAEAETSVSLRVLPVDGGGESFEVQARGELQLGLLIGDCLLPLSCCPSGASKTGAPADAPCLWKSPVSLLCALMLIRMQCTVSHAHAIAKAVV